MRIWLFLGFLSIIIYEATNISNGSPIKIDGKRLVFYLLLMFGGVGTLLWTIYRLFNADPILINEPTKEGPNEATETDTDVGENK